MQKPHSGFYSKATGVYSGLDYVSPKLVPCRIPLGFHNKAVLDERRRDARSSVIPKTTSPSGLLYD